MLKRIVPQRIAPESDRRKTDLNSARITALLLIRAWLHSAQHRPGRSTNFGFSPVFTRHSGKSTADPRVVCFLRNYYRGGTFFPLGSSWPLGDYFLRSLEDTPTAFRDIILYFHVLFGGSKLFSVTTRPCKGGVQIQEWKVLGER